MFKVSDTNAVAVADFVRAVKIDPALKENSVVFSIYEAANGETPEIISHKFYNTTEYHWVIMALNEKFDPYRDFPQHDHVIIAYATEKYGSDGINDIHHYVDENGNIVDQFYPLGTPITNLEYERQVNEDNRTMKIMRRDVLSEFVDSYQTLIAK